MDNIVHVPDLTAFRLEVKSKEPDLKLLALDKNGEVVFLVDKTPVFYNGNESLCLFRCHPSSLSGLDNMVVIGKCENSEYTFNSPEDEAEYIRVKGDSEKIGLFV